MVLKDNVIISSGLQARWHLRKMIPDSLICLTAPIASLIIYRLRGSQFIFTEQILLCWDLLGPNIQLLNWHPHRNVPKASSRSAHSIFKNHDINIPSLCYAFPRICVFGNKISIQPEKCGVFYAASPLSCTSCLDTHHLFYLGIIFLLISSSLVPSTSTLTILQSLPCMQPVHSLLKNHLILLPPPSQIETVTSYCF